MRSCAGGQQTIGAAYGEKTVVVDGRPVKVSLWDTAGSERYESMTKMYYRGSSVALVCYGLHSSCLIQASTLDNFVQARERTNKQTSPTQFR